MRCPPPSSPPGKITNISSPGHRVGQGLGMSYLPLCGRFPGDFTIFLIVSHPSGSGSSSCCLTVSLPLLLIMSAELAPPDIPVPNNGIISLPVTAAANFRVVFLSDSLPSLPSVFQTRVCWNSLNPRLRIPYLPNSSAFMLAVPSTGNSLSLTHSHLVLHLKHTFLWEVFLNFPLLDLLLPSS